MFLWKKFIEYGRASRECLVPHWPINLFSVTVMTERAYVNKWSSFARTYVISINPKTYKKWKIKATYILTPDFFYILFHLILNLLDWWLSKTN